MISLLLWKEHLKVFYNKYSYGIRPLLRFLFTFCAVMSLNMNIGYMTKLKNPLIVLLACLLGALLPWGAIVFLAGCFMIAHLYAVSIEMALITLVLIITMAVLYYGFKPGDSFLIILTALAFLFKVPYAVPVLAGLGASLASVIPVSFGVFIYYLMMYVKQNAGILAGEASVDFVQKYSQIFRSVLVNKTMIMMMAACAVGIVIVYLIRRLAVDYAWPSAVIGGLVSQLLVILVGSFLFEASVAVGELILGMILSAVIGAVYTFFVFTVDYTRTEYVQFEDDDYYYYVKAVPKMTVSTPDVKVQKISTRKRSVRERNAN